DTLTVLTVTPAVPAVADRRRVTIYEFAGPDVPLWGYAYPERLTGGSVFVPGRRRPDGTIEVGRTIVRNRYQPGVRLDVAGIEPGRAVLVGDAATDPVGATVEAATIVGATVAFEPTAADATTASRLGLDAASSSELAGVVSTPLPPSFTLAPKPQLRVRVGALPARTIALA